MEWTVLILLGGLIVALVLAPFFSRQPHAYDWDGTGATDRRAQRTAEIEAEVLRYRDALRAGTICTRCGQANPAGSRFCGECGRALPNAPVQPAALEATSST
jgi:hypothetical protein